MSRANAFLDESQRAGGYVIASALISHAEVQGVRRALRAVAPKGRARLHFVRESESSRRKLVAVFAALEGVRVVAVRTGLPGPVIAQRERCLGRLAEHLSASNVDRVLLDHVEPHQQRRDRAILHPRLHASGTEFSHLDDHSAEPMLWIPDAVAWCVGHPVWRREVDEWVEVIDL